MCVFFHLSPSVQGHTGFLQVALFGFSSNLTSLGEFVGFGWSLDTMRAQDEHRGFFGFGFCGLFCDSWAAAQQKSENRSEVSTGAYIKATSRRNPGQSVQVNRETA